MTIRFFFFSKYFLAIRMHRLQLCVLLLVAVVFCCCLGMGEGRWCVWQERQCELVNESIYRHFRCCTRRVLSEIRCSVVEQLACFVCRGINPRSAFVLWTCRASVLPQDVLSTHTRALENGGLFLAGVSSRGALLDASRVAVRVFARSFTALMNRGTRESE